jgi:hypothetical protein
MKVIDLLAVTLHALRMSSAASSRVLPADFFLSKRASAVEAIWGWGAALPTRSQPDVGPLPTNVSGVTSIQWNLGKPGRKQHLMNSSVPDLVSTVSIVRKNGENGPRASRAFLLHHGHSKLGAENDTPGATWYDYYNMSSFLSELADADVFIVSMPFYGINAVPEVSEDHTWLRQFEVPGHSPKENATNTLQFFMEPVVLSTNYAFALGYDEVHLTGKSGGGWTTTVAAAIDPRLQFTVPDAGSLPEDFNHTSWEYEQLPGLGDFYARLDFTDMYALAALEPGRLSLQLLHEDDPCCFAGRDRHDQIKAYDAAVQGVLEDRGAGVAARRGRLDAMQRMGSGQLGNVSSDYGWFSTAVVDWDEHEYSPRDKAVISEAWGLWTASAPYESYGSLPCDILNAPDVPCPC